MTAIDLKKNVLTHVDRADDRLLKLMNALAESYFEDERQGRISVVKYNQELDAAVEDIENGNYLTQDDVRKITRKW